MSFTGKSSRLLLFIVIIVFVGCSSAKDMPEMKELLDQFSDRGKRVTVLQKYGEPGVVPVELTQCDMSKPIVTKTEEKNGIVYFTLESRVEKCEHSEAAAGTVRIFVMGWKNQRIVNFNWGGPKGGKVEY